MKNTVKLFGIIALVAVIGFSMAACDNGGGTTREVDPRIVGTWDNIDGSGDWIRFDATGTFKEYYDGEYDSGTFSTSGNTLTMTMQGIGTFSATFVLSNNNNTLHIHGTINIPNFGPLPFDDTFNRRITDPGPGPTPTPPGAVTTGFYFEPYNEGYAVSQGLNMPAGTVMVIPSTHNSRPVIAINEFDRRALTGVTIPNSVRYIWDRAFRDGNLETVIIPDSVIRIEADAFENNRLTSITIPANVAYIGNTAFRDNNLTSVTILGRVDEMGGSIFSGNSTLSSVAIPFDTLEEADEEWGVEWREGIPDNVGWVFNG